MPEHSEEIAQMRLDYSTDQRVWDLLDEVERLRAELRTTVERSEAMKARCKEAVALWRGDVDRLRDALGAILDGLTDALGDPMGARPSQVTTLYSAALHAMRPISKEVSDD